MQAHQAEFEARGAGLVAVGQGTGEDAAEVCGELEIDYPCLGDPDRRGYRAFGLGRASWWGITAGPMLENPALGLRRLAHANLRRSASPHSDVRQLPGVAIVDQDGLLRYLYRAEKTDDLPGAGALLEALERLTC
jgi:hypothetical protein